MRQAIINRGIIVSLLLSAILSTAILSGCSKKEAEKPEIIDCTKVSYNGTTWTLDDCRKTGASSYRVQITQNGKKACFQVTCDRSGCVVSITVCSGQELSPLAPE